MLREVPGQCPCMMLREVPGKFPLLGTVPRDVKHNKVESFRSLMDPLKGVRW